MPSLAVGVDEFTLVLQPLDKVSVMAWPDMADLMLSVFLEKSRLVNLFGKWTTPQKFRQAIHRG